MMRAFLIFLLVAFIGGSLNSTFLKIGGNEIPPLTLTFLRFLGAAILMFPFWAKHKRYIAAKDIVKILPFTFNVALFSVGIQLTSVIMANIIYALTPVLVGIFGHFLINEKMKKHYIIGLAFSLLGIAILIEGSVKTSDILSFGTPLGNTMLLFGAVCWAFYPISFRSLSKRYTSVTILFWNFALSAILLIPVALFELQIRPIMFSKITYAGLSSIVGLIVLSSVVHYFLYQWLIKHTSAFIASLVQYGGILFAVITGIIIFHERITMQLLIGGTLVILGLFIATTYQYVKSRL